MPVTLGLISFVLGLLVGSFLNVLIDRLANEESPFKGRSHCDHCGKTLEPLDLIPVISFLWLGGKCRYCKRKLSWQYPLVELLTGILLVCFTVHYQVINIEPLFINIAYIPLLLILLSLFVIFISDLKYRIIPDEMIVVLLVGTVLYGLFNKINWQEHGLSSLAVTGLFLLIILLTKGKGMGLGDVKYVLFMGLFLGPLGTITALYISFLTGAAVSLILILGKLKSLKSQIAFGPFLIFGTIVSFYFGEAIQMWYTKLFL